MNMKFLSLTALATAVLLSACGGGGGSNEGGGQGGNTPPPSNAIQGTAATGAPMDNALIIIKDSQGHIVTGSSDEQGRYAISVTGLIEPYLIKAQLGDEVQYAFAFSSDINGTINITPLTTLITGNALGASPQTVFTNLTTEALTNLSTRGTAAIAATQLITSALGVSGNPLRDAFTPNHTGMDAVLDVLTIKVNGSTATVQDKLGNTLISDDLTSTTDITQELLNDIEPALDKLASAVTEYSTVLTGVNTLLQQMASECGNVSRYTGSSCTGLYAGTNYLDHGDTTPSNYFDDDGDGQPDEPGIVVTFTDPAILERLSSTEYRIAYTLTGAWGDDLDKALRMETIVRKNTLTGQWQYAGSQTDAWLDWHYKDWGGDIGWVFDVVVKFPNENIPAGFDHVLVQGPGLPTAGVTLTTDNFTVDGFNNYRATLCAPEIQKTLPYCPNSNNGHVIPDYSLSDAPVPIERGYQNLYTYTVYNGENAVLSQSRQWLRVTR